MAQFIKATKRQGFLRLALIGASGSGKTFTSLVLAKYLAPTGKIALIDTEHASASKYADLFTFDTLQLTSFDPREYIEAINAAEQAGYELLILDSYSHAWAGKDGVLEFVDKLAKRNGGGGKFAAWSEGTPLHNSLIEKMLSAKLHIIATMRAKTEYAMETDERTHKTSVRKVGIGPVQRDQVEYEFDVVGEMNQENELVVTKTRCSALTGRVFSKPGQEMAEILRIWLTEGAPAYDREGRTAYLKSLREEWVQLGGKPPALTLTRVRQYSEQELEAEIDMTESEVVNLRQPQPTTQTQAGNGSGPTAEERDDVFSRPLPAQSF